MSSPGTDPRDRWSTSVEVRMARMDDRLGRIESDLGEHRRESRESMAGLRSDLEERDRVLHKRITAALVRDRGPQDPGPPPPTGAGVATPTVLERICQQVTDPKVLVAVVGLLTIIAAGALAWSGATDDRPGGDAVTEAP